MLGTFQVQNVPSSLLDQLQNPIHQDWVANAWAPCGMTHLMGMYHCHASVQTRNSTRRVTQYPMMTWCPHGRWKRVTSVSLLPAFGVLHIGNASPYASTFTWVALATMSAISKTGTPCSPQMCKNNLDHGSGRTNNHVRHARTPCQLTGRILPVTQKPTKLD